MSLIQVSTSATDGAVFVPFASNRAGNGSITNDTGVSIDLRLSPTGAITKIAAGSRFPFSLVWGTAEVEVRRTDQVATAVTVELEFSMGTSAPAAVEASAAAAAAVAADNLASAAAAFTRVITLSGNLVLTSADKQMQRITPDADRDVTLHTESGAAWTLRVMHAGTAFNLTIKRAGGAVVATLIPGGSILVGWDGTAFWS